MRAGEREGRAQNQPSIHHAHNHTHTHTRGLPAHWRGHRQLLPENAPMCPFACTCARHLPPPPASMLSAAPWRRRKQPTHCTAGAPREPALAGGPPTHRKMAAPRKPHAMHAARPLGVSRRMHACMPRRAQRLECAHTQAFLEGNAKRHEVNGQSPIRPGNRAPEAAAVMLGGRNHAR